MSEYHIILLMYVSMKTLIYCLNKLKTEKDSEIYRNALALVQKVPLEFVNNSNNGSNELIMHEDYNLCIFFTKKQ